ncbi:MAG: GAF domain-containing sensor histidine kinase [Chloroflexi bacterium]|nr:GAF domain-containing sensor histidine kinase [Chloroflexota bacterium]
MGKSHSGVREMNLDRLKWIAIVAPVAILLTIDYVRHFVSWTAFLHTPVGFAFIYGSVLVGVTLFFELGFRLIKRMQERMAQQNKELAAVAQLAESLSRAVGVDQILQESLRRVVNLVEADAGVICLLDAEKQELFSTACIGFSQRVLDNIRHQKLGSEPIGTQVVSKGTPVVVPNLLEYGDPRIVQGAREEGFLSSATIPMTSQGKVVGVFAVAFRHAGAIQGSTVQFISAIANQVAVTVEKASIYQEASRRAQDLAVLNRISAVASSSLELKEVMQAALSAIVELTNMEAGEVWLWEESTQEMVLAVHHGAWREAFNEVTRFGKGEGFPGQVALTGEAVISNDIAQDEHFVRSAVRRVGVHLFACVPLKAKGKVVGAIDLATREQRGLTPRELQLLTSIGNQIGVAIDNARLHRRVQNLAIAEERGRIAREIHDGVGQVLGYVNTKTMAAKQHLDANELDLAREQLSELESAAKDVYADLREAILGLRSGLYRKNGFIPILEEYLESFFQMSQIPVAFSVTPEGPGIQFDPQQEIHVIRIIQEALSNVRRHSGASQAWLGLEAADEQIIVTVRDNGHGYDASRLSRGERPRFGLQTMRERAEAIGGRLEIKSQHRSGTEVRLTIPHLD